MSYRMTPVVFFNVLALLCLTTMPVRGATQSYSESNDPFNEDYLLIVDVYLRNIKLAENVFIYNPPETTLIPLQPIFDGLDFSIEADPTAGKASGWFIKESNDFDLDINNREVFIRNQSMPPEQTQIMLSDDFDIYVDISLLNDWFPLEINLDTGRLRINIIANQPLPIENKMAREKKRKRSLNKRGKIILPRFNDHYDWIGSPTIDLTVSGGLDNDESRSSYSLYTSGDLLAMEARFSTSGQSSSGSNNTLLTFNKKPNEINGNILFGVDRFSMGDIYGASDNLVLSGGNGLGINVEYGASSDHSEFGKKTITGDAPAGWEVELYRNGSLIDFRSIDNEGRYRFEDIPVEYGENIFDIRLFGPQGQEQNRRETFTVGEQMLSAGQHYGRLSFIDQNSSVFNNDDDTEAEKDLYLEWQQGINDSLSAGGAFIQINSPEETRSFTSIQLQGAFPSMTAGINAAFENSSGWGGTISGQSRIKSTAISFLHKQFNDFSTQRSNDGHIKSESELRLSGSALLSNKKSLRYDILNSYDTQVGGLKRHTMNFKFGYQMYGGHLTSDASFVNTSSKNADSISTWTGKSSYSRNVAHSIRARGDLNYDIDPKPLIKSGSTNFSWHANPALRAQLGLNLDFTGNASNQLSLSGSYIFDIVTLSLNTHFSDKGDTSISLTSEWSLAPKKWNSWSVTGEKRAGNGRVNAHIFLDNDEDQHYSDGDKPLQGIKFAGRGHWGTKETNNEGWIYLDDFSSNSLTTLRIVEKSIPDPYWKPAYTEVQVVSHAGAVQTIEIPVHIAIEVEGNIALNRNGKERPLPGVPLRVLDNKGNTVAESQSEFDGYFVITGLKSGDYTLIIDEKALAHYKLEPVAPIPFSADSADGIVYIDPIVL